MQKWSGSLKRALSHHSLQPTWHQHPRTTLYIPLTAWVNTSKFPKQNFPPSHPYKGEREALATPPSDENKRRLHRKADTVKQTGTTKQQPLNRRVERGEPTNPVVTHKNTAPHYGSAIKLTTRRKSNSVHCVVPPSRDRSRSAVGKNQTPWGTARRHPRPAHWHRSWIPWSNGEHIDIHTPIGPWIDTACAPHWILGRLPPPSPSQERRDRHELSGNGDRCTEYRRGRGPAPRPEWLDRAVHDGGHLPRRCNEYVGIGRR